MEQREILQADNRTPGYIPNYEGYQNKAKFFFQNSDTSHMTPNPIALTNKVIKFAPRYFCGVVYTQHLP